ncbi:unnamed protein product, partial [Heterosigma akashiwo]
MQEFKASDSTIRRIWKNMQSQIKQGLCPFDDLAPKLTTRGRKRVMDTPEFRRRFKAVPKDQRMTIRQAVESTGIPYNIIKKMMKKKVAKKKASRVKPYLTPVHRYLRLKWCLGRTERLLGAGRSRRMGGGVRILTGWNVYHVDEKNFELTRRTQKSICLDDESPMKRHVVHKSHIPKLMFLACTTRPNRHPVTDELITGAVAIFPFIEEVEAKSSSHNRPAGTLEIKPRSVNAETYIDAMINFVLPKIKRHWKKQGQTRKDLLIIQEDNASPHKLGSDPRWIENIKKWNIKLISQPAQSPDLNKLDLGAFASMQSLTWNKGMRDLSDLVFEVTMIFLRYDNDKLLDLDLTHQNVIKHVILNKGKHDTVPHMHKQKLKKAGELPEYLTMTEE